MTINHLDIFCSKILNRLVSWIIRKNKIELFNMITMIGSIPDSKVDFSQNESELLITAVEKQHIHIVRSLLLTQEINPSA